MIQNYKLHDWKNIPEYKGKYQVNANGQIRRVFPSGKTRMMTPYEKKKINGSKRFVVKLTKDGKAKEVMVLQIVARVFLGACPNGCVPYHKNGMQHDNFVNNIAYIPRKELGKITGAQSRRRPVAKIGIDGEVIEFYSSARECARCNYCSYQTVADRCNGKVSSAFGEIDFAWDDSEESMKLALKRLGVRA